MRSASSPLLLFSECVGENSSEHLGPLLLFGGF